LHRKINEMNAEKSHPDGTVAAEQEQSQDAR
jgi:hypothetical protein